MAIAGSHRRRGEDARHRGNPDHAKTTPAHVTCQRRTFVCLDRRNTNEYELENGCGSCTGRCVVGGPGNGGPWRRWRAAAGAAWWRRWRRRRPWRRRRWRIPRRRRRLADIHTPSFSTPHQNFNTPHPSFNDAGVSPRRRRFGRRLAAMSPGNRPGIGQRPGIANTPNWDNRLNAGNRPTSTIVRILGTGPTSGNRRTSATTSVTRTTSAGQRIQLARRRLEPRRLAPRGLARQLEQLLVYYRPVGWWTAGYWAGAAASAIPWSWGYWPYYNPYYTGPFVDGSATIDYSQPIVVAQPAVSPPAPSGSDRRATGDALARCGAECLHAGRLPDRAGPGGPGHCASAQRHRAPRVPRPGALRAGALQGSGGRRLCRAVRRSRLGLDDAQRPLSERGCLHGATPRLGAVRKIAPGGIGREIPAGRSLPDLRATPMPPPHSSRKSCD